jgi:hypothetical protein
VPAYNAAFPVGSTVRVLAADRLLRFKETWKFHDLLRDGQIAFAGRVTVVASIGYYHGGDPLYGLKDLPGVWHEVCLEGAWSSPETANRATPAGRRRYDAPGRRHLRLALVVVGFTAAVYGVASLTGTWLGTPPWWEREMSSAEEREAIVEDVYLRHGWAPKSREDPGRWTVVLDSLATAVAKDGRAWISGGVVAVGLGLVAFGAWPRRRRPATGP